VAETACQEQEPQVGYWRERARLLSEENEWLRTERDALTAKVTELEEQLEAAKEALVGLARELRHPSERSGKAEGAGEDEGTDGTTAGPGAGPGTAKRGRGQRRGAPGHGRRSYEHLPTKEVLHEPDELACPTCGAPYERLPGEDRSEELDWSVLLRRVVHRRPRYRRTCHCKGTKGVITAPPPPKAIAKGRFSTGSLARIVVAKFVVGLPCQRIISLLALEGAAFSAGTLAGVLAQVAPLLAPLANAIRERNATAGVLHADETSWPVFVELPDRPRRRWWLWVFISPDTIVYVLKPDRDTAVVAGHLGIDLAAKQPCLPGGRELVLFSDFYSVYQSLGMRVKGVRNSWCWAHVRRHFIKAGDAHPDLKDWSERWARRIGALFKAHKDFALAPAGSPAERQARKALNTALAEIDTTRQAEADDPGLPKAAAKVLAMVGRERPGLGLAVATPAFDLDNNAAERGLRGPVVGRKNYYGSGATWSAALAADAWTITATIAKAGWSPLAHLVSYLEACAEAGGRAPSGDELSAFLPWAASPTDAARWARAP
jgi:transposase